MARRGRSVRVAPGIFRDEGGYRVVATFGTRSKEKRLSLTSTPAELRDEREALRKALRGNRVVFDGTGGTFSADVRTYLKQVTHFVSYKSRRSELLAWSEALGGYFIRRRLDDGKAREIVSGWLKAGVAPATVKHRLNALNALYRALDGEDAVLPTRGITVHIPKRRPLTVTPDVIIQVEANLAQQEIPVRKDKTHGRLGDSKTRARFRVMAAMGMRPASLKRVKPVQLDLVRGILMLDGTKGGEPVGLKLNADMRAAWELFVAAKAWGEFDTRSYARTLRTAGWPKGIRPYNVRHSLGQDLAEAGEDYEDIRDVLGHSDVATTKAFYVPTLSGRLAKLSDRIEGRLQWRVPSPVPSAALTNAKKSKQNSTRPRSVRSRNQQRSMKK